MKLTGKNMSTVIYKRREVAVMKNLSGKCTTVEVARINGWSQNYASRLLRKMEKDGLVKWAGEKGKAHLWERIG